MTMNSSTRDVVKQIAPLRICRFNELEFPNSRPVLDIFLALNCRLRRIELLKIHQHFEFVAFGKSAHETFAMFVDAANKIIRHADIQCASRLVREDVDPIGCHGCEASWIAVQSAATITLSCPGFDPGIHDALTSVRALRKPADAEPRHGLPGQARQ